MRVGATDLEADGAIYQSSALALNAHESPTDLHAEITPCVLAEGLKYRVTRFVKRKIINHQRAREVPA